MKWFLALLIFTGASYRAKASWLHLPHSYMGNPKSLAQPAFECFKQSFTIAPILHHPDRSIPLIIEVDAYGRIRTVAMTWWPCQTLPMHIHYKKINLLGLVPELVNARTYTKFDGPWFLSALISQSHGSQEQQRGCPLIILQISLISWFGYRLLWKFWENSTLAGTGKCKKVHNSQFCSSNILHKQPLVNFKSQTISNHTQKVRTSQTTSPCKSFPSDDQEP